MGMRLTPLEASMTAWLKTEEEVVAEALERLQDGVRSLVAVVVVLRDFMEALSLNEVPMNPLVVRVPPMDSGWF